MIPLAILAGLGLLVAAVLVLRDTNTSSAPSGRPLPRSMAAIGDSITQAVAVTDDAYGAAPEHSWATGTDGSDAVTSHYERLIREGALQGNVYNNSIPGAQVADAVEQAQSTVSQQVDYVSILIGANDVCAPDTASMTSTASFEASFEEVMRTLDTGLPRASIFVASIPNVYRLWEVSHDQLGAQTIWDTVGICRSVLAQSASEDDRLGALARNEAFNEILERVCARYSDCRFDGGAVFDHEFGEEHIGPLDYFHPSMDGQAVLADVTWRMGFWPEI